ncbi:MAG: TIGR00159 family protein [Ruminococcaceae bacterium]|nr:TIGR00159 family protein [Oscillospiraceae bacterium]
MTLIEQNMNLFEKIIDFFMDYVVFPIQHITFVNILDIALLTVFIYMIYKFVRDRNAGRVLIGFVLLIVLYIISDVLNMVAINSILQNFYALGIIAICILFQPELREVLAEFGSTTSENFHRITNRHAVNTDETLKMLEEVSAAAFELSAKGEGALIVLERSGRLNNQLAEGTPIDALVSRQLLCNIFVNKSPLHDGAVLIRNGRIVSASNKSKTISENTRVAGGLGTRHRAALKISEVSDAVVVIVSEETGNISIANNNLLKRNYHDIGKKGKHKSTDLRDDLFKLMTGKSVNDWIPEETDANAGESAIVEREEKGEGKNEKA